MTTTIGFLGAGKMAEALVGALAATGEFEPWQIMMCERSPERAQYMAETYGVAVTDRAEDVVAACTMIFIAVKPQDLDALLASVKPHFKTTHVLVSIVAGKTLATLKKAVGTKPRIIRVMPNLALTVGEGACAYCCSSNVKANDAKRVATILGVAGAVLPLSEKHFDAVTALSGSGPAFFAYVLDAMIAAGVALKLPPDVARLLAEQTMIGTGVYLQQRGEDIPAFITAVSSAKGTTAAGMAVLSKSSVRATIERTLAAAATRSAELAKV